MIAEVLKKKLEQRPVDLEVSRKLGASACSGCPLMKLGCPGKAETAQECPPQAEQIKQEEVKRAIIEDDGVTAVFADDGGYFAVPKQADKPRAAELKTEQIPAKKSQKPNVKPTVKLPERKRISSQPSLLELMGELAASLLLIAPKVK